MKNMFIAELEMYNYKSGKYNYIFNIQEDHLFKVFK